MGSMTEAPDILRIALAQLNPTVGDIAGNLSLARAARADAARQKADLVVFTELFLAGYPPDDLVLKPTFVAACRKACEELAADTADGGPGVIMGTPWLDAQSGLHNAVAVMDAGTIQTLRYKVDLPNYGVFDEKRVFARPDAGAGELSRCAARHSHLRGHLGRSGRVRNA